MSQGAGITFVAEVLLVGVNPYVVVTTEQGTSLRAQWRRPMPVLVRVNELPATPWRTNLMPAGDGSFLLYLHGEMRKMTGVDVGDSVRVDLRFDDAYRNGPLHETPEWFQRALDENSQALANWHALVPSRQKEVLRYFAGLKTDEAKARNLVRAMRVLSGESERFMGRDWLEGK